jgi:hypothetical protein
MSTHAISDTGLSMTMVHAVKSRPCTSLRSQEMIIDRRNLRLSIFLVNIRILFRHPGYIVHWSSQTTNSNLSRRSFNMRFANELPDCAGV